VPCWGGFLSAGRAAVAFGFIFPSVTLCIPPRPDGCSNGYSSPFGGISESLLWQVGYLVTLSYVYDPIIDNPLVPLREAPLDREGFFSSGLLRASFFLASLLLEENACEVFFFGVY